jgi:hypothetical protein
MRRPQENVVKSDELSRVRLSLAMPSGRDAPKQTRFSRFAGGALRGDPPMSNGQLRSEPLTMEFGLRKFCSVDAEFQALFLFQGLIAANLLDFREPQKL